jgi:hypothetical protein
MRETTRRPGAQADPEAPQSASDADGGGGAGDAQQAARQQRAQKRREAAHDAEADAFNQRHAAEVGEFNQLTKDACLGDDGKVDAAAVKEWQREHNVAPDGKVGPKTIAAAGGKAPNAAAGADAQVAKPNAAPPPKAKSPIEDAMSWIDASPIGVILEHIGILGKQAQAGAKPEAGAAEAKPLPDVSGLASEVSIGHFAEAAKALEKEQNWRPFSPHERAHKLVQAANTQLKAAGALEIEFKFDSALSSANPGQFFHEEWAMHLFRAPFVAKKLDGKTAASLVDTVYHEARHAEQNFRIARLLAGQQGMTIEKIQKQTSIARRAIEVASKNPLAADDPQSKQAQAMFDDKYGAGHDHHKTAEEDAKLKINAYKEVQKRAEDPKASPDDKAAAQRELEAMKPSVKAAWEAYSSLATEADALPTGQRAAAAMSPGENKP